MHVLFLGQLKSQKTIQQSYFRLQSPQGFQEMKMKDSRRGVFPRERPRAPKISRKHAAGCKMQEVYLGYTGTCGRQGLSENLRACRLGMKGFYRGAKARVQKQKSFHFIGQFK